MGLGVSLRIIDLETDRQQCVDPGSPISGQFNKMAASGQKMERFPRQKNQREVGCQKPAEVSGMAHFVKHSSFGRESDRSGAQPESH